MKSFLPYLFVGCITGGIVGYFVVRYIDAHHPAPANPPKPLTPAIPPDMFDPLAEADETPAPTIAIPAGEFVMGNDDGAADEKPAHTVKLKAFRMETTEVTNARFAAFVKATKYVTVAERQPDPKKYPGADPELLKPGSAVFKPVTASLDPRTWDTPYPPWWKYVIGANWKHPNGPGSNLKGKMSHPVVQIAWEDAAAYAKWAKRQLPTEAEWEYAARGGLAKKEYCWGDTKQGTDGTWFANTFQGEFPDGDTGADGFKGTSPIKSFPPNKYGLYDTSGNVWEWCADWYDSKYYATSPKENPPGPEKGELDGGMPQRVRRGGSFLCAEKYCRRYVPSARDKNPEDSGADHTGFRCVE